MHIKIYVFRAKKFIFDVKFEFQALVLTKLGLLKPFRPIQAVKNSSQNYKVEFLAQI